MPSHHIVIIGGGVTGLTTACELLQRNYKVTVIAERYANQGNRITSQIAGVATCGLRPPHRYHIAGKLQTLV